MRADSGGVGIEYEVTGEGRPVVLLHGFPDSGRLWRHQVRALADAGFMVIVPDMRGYGTSDKPADVAAYNMLFLVSDIGAVLDHAGVERAHVVGHDWGAAVAWVLASVAPERVDHLVTLSVGHPSSFRSDGYAQHEKSWYMLLFQFEGIAEHWLSDDDWANFRNWGHHPDEAAVIGELEANAVPDARPQLVPGQRPARVLHRPAARSARGAGPHHGGVEQRRHRADRGADDALGGACRRPLALRAARRPRPLDAARGARGGQPVVAGLPARLTRQAGLPEPRRQQADVVFDATLGAAATAGPDRTSLGGKGHRDSRRTRATRPCRRQVPAPVSPPARRCRRAWWCPGAIPSAVRGRPSRARPRVTGLRPGE